MKNFNEIYQKIHTEKSSIVEEERKKDLNKFIVIICIAIIISLTLNVMQFNHGAVLVLLILGVISIFFLIGGKHNSMYKQLIINSLIKEISDKLSYNPNGRMNSVDYRSAEFEKIDIFTSEDYITGIMDDETKIEIAEVKTKNESRDEDGNKTQTTVFHGLFGSIKIKEYITLQMKIHSNREILGKILNSRTRLEMDSSEFEKYFDVYTKDKMIGMQLLTSDVMLKLIEFRQKINKEYEITIKNSHIYIRIKCGEVFEASKLKETMDYNTLKNYYDMLNLFFEISEQIKNNIKQIKGE